MPPCYQKITTILRKKRFDDQLRKLSPDILKAAKSAIADLYKYPIPASLRLHSISGTNPKIFTIDVMGNHSYKISLELDGNTAILRRIATHKEIDRDPY